MTTSDAPPPPDPADHAVPRVSFGATQDEEPEPAQDDAERALQEENAETSLDQPSS